MNVLLVRVGIDQTFGGWNAPVDPITREYVYVPIPEYPGVTCHPNMSRRFGEFAPSLQVFSQKHACELIPPKIPPNRLMHLDPDFSELTYGDIGSRRGARIRDMKCGDVLAFYASLSPISHYEHKLLYAMIGLYVIDEILPIHTVPKDQWHRNAHTRRRRHAETDIVVRARPGVSGRFEKCIPIGCWKDRSYRVRPDLLDIWGGLSVRDGYIQRSAVPPRILEPTRFLKWTETHDVNLIAKNFAVERA